jgi:hypothetical protein
MDASTARDMIEDLLEERSNLWAILRQLENEILVLGKRAIDAESQVRQLEAERDQWQRRAVNND